jgi:hypothetical protein
MELPRPACGNWEAHSAHAHYPGGMREVISCPGWSAEENGVVRMITVLHRFASDHTPPRGRMPPRVQLQMHPSVYYSLMRNIIPGYGEFIQGEPTFLPPEIPVLASASLPEGTWRLVTADVIEEGKTG